MSNIRNRIERGFELFARMIYRNRIKTLLVVVAITVAIIAQIPKITIDTSMEGFLHAEDPAMLTYNAFRDQFGRDEVVIVALQPGNVFDLEFLKTLNRLQRDLKEAR